MKLEIHSKFFWAVPSAKSVGVHSVGHYNRNNLFDWWLSRRSAIFYLIVRCVCVFSPLLFSLFVSRFGYIYFFRPAFFLSLSFSVVWIPNAVYALAHFLPFPELLDFSLHSHIQSLTDSCNEQRTKKNDGNASNNKQTSWRTRTRLCIFCVVFRLCFVFPRLLIAFDCDWSAQMLVISKFSDKMR